MTMTALPPPAVLVGLGALISVLLSVAVYHYGHQRGRSQFTHEGERVVNKAEWAEYDAWRQLSPKDDTPIFLHVRKLCNAYEEDIRRESQATAKAVGEWKRAVGAWKLTEDALASAVSDLEERQRDLDDLSTANEKAWDVVDMLQKDLKRTRENESPPLPSWAVSENTVGDVGVGPFAIHPVDKIVPGTIFTGNANVSAPTPGWGAL